MLTKALAHPWLSGIAVAVGLMAASMVMGSGTANAQSCFDTIAERNSALPIGAGFPRTIITRTNSCALPAANTPWSIVSSYYYNSSSSYSTLHTPNLRLKSFIYDGGTGGTPPSAQTLLVAWRDRCSFSGPTEVWAVDRDPTAPTYGSQYLGELTGSDTSEKLVAMSYTAQWRRGGALYGDEMWVDQMTIEVRATGTFPGSTISCKVRIANATGALMSFSEEPDSLSAYGEGSQRYNYNNWSGAGKRILGPNLGSDGSYALWNGMTTAQDVQYAIPFAASCNITSTRTTRLRIYDMDHPVDSVFGVGATSPGPKQASRPYMSLFREDTGARVPLTGNGFTNATTVEVRIGNDEYAEYTFTVEPDVRYTWVFWNIYSRNGLQLWMPFSEVHASFGCPDAYDYYPRIYRNGAATTTAPGLNVYALPRNFNLLTGLGDNYLMDIYPADNTTARYVTRLNAPDGASTIYGPGISTSWGRDGLRWTRPGIDGSAVPNYWNPSTWPAWQVNTDAPDGINLCFRVRVSPNSATTPGWEYSTTNEGGTICWRNIRRIYNYDPSLPVAQARYNGLFYAGRQFDVSNTITNNGDTTGPTYTNRFTVTPAGVTGDPFNHTAGGLAAGGSRVTNTRTLSPYRFTIPATTAHGTVGSCTSRVQPNTGLGPPSPFTGLGTTHTRTRATCYTVENRQFNIPALNTADVLFSETTLLPTQAFDVNATVCNDGGLPAGAVGATSRRTRIRIIADTNVRGGPYDTTIDVPRGCGPGQVHTQGFTVNSTARLGEQACVRVIVDRVSGFSFPAPLGFAVANGPRTFTQCVDVAEQGYFEVENGSVWSGGDFDPSPTGYGNDYCTAVGSGQIITARLNGIGAWADYIAGASGSISNFGSEHINTGDPFGTGLTFANNALPGSFGIGHCITDLYTYLSQDTSRANLGTLPGTGSWPAASGQWVRSGDWDVNTPRTISGAVGASPAQRYTIIVDGDVTINENITFNNYNINDKDNLPSFILVVRGDINISGDVTRLDGLYFARPSGAIGSGVIDTCSDDPDTLPVAVRGNLANTVCEEQLEVYGAFIANDIQFRRTHGGVSGGNVSPSCATGICPAEIFRFSSELFLADHFLISENAPELKIDNMIDLPPVIN